MHSAYYYCIVVRGRNVLMRRVNPLSGFLDISKYEMFFFFVVIIALNIVLIDTSCSLVWYQLWQTASQREPCLRPCITFLSKLFDRHVHVVIHMRAWPQQVKFTLPGHPFTYFGFPECPCCLENNIYSRLYHDYGLMRFD